MTVTALIVAAGSGNRMGGDVPKQYREISGKAVLAHAFDALATHRAVGRVRIVTAPGQEQLAHQALRGRDAGTMIVGGAERSNSVRAGLASVEDELVLVHDAARPFCPHEVIDRLLGAIGAYDGAVPVLPIADTVARSDGQLGDPVDRQGLVRVQTPQAFRTGQLRDAYERWEGAPPTDEATVARAAGLRVAAIEGSEALEKLTRPEDWTRAEARLSARLVSRTGMGFDVHAFGGEGPIMLGGIPIPHPRGLGGHSDADVLLHAMTDALLGAAGLGDIGDHFPPSDARWKGAASELFLAHAASLVRDRGGIIDFIDSTLICEAPRVGPHRAAMRSRVAEILGICERQVSIKATTTEKLGFTGRSEGIAAQAVATVRMEVGR